MKRVGGLARSSAVMRGSKGPWIGALIRKAEERGGSMIGVQIPGYTFGTKEAAKSPITDSEFDLLKQTVTFTDEDAQYLRMAGEVLDDQLEEVLDVWYDFFASHPHLAYYFSGPDEELDRNYLAAVRLRFEQWIRDTCSAQYDRAWLDYQEEIALRHTRLKKNQTDNVLSPADHIHLRYVLAALYPIVATIKPFLARKGHSPEEVERMHQAWFKSVVLQVTLWARPYVRPGDF